MPDKLWPKTRDKFVAGSGTDFLCAVCEWITDIAYCIGTEESIVYKHRGTDCELPVVIERQTIWSEKIK